MIRRVVVFALLLVALLAAVPAYGQEGDDPGKIVVAEVSGPLDQRTLDYLEDAVTTDAQLVILQIDAPGIASGDPRSLYATLTEVATPVAMWIGPDGAEAFGGAGALRDLVDVVGAAPGAELGLRRPLVASSPTSRSTG